jgi:hypothetical protein
MNPDTQQRLGKKNVINNFCTAIPSNYEFCTACHVGYGWKDQNFDFASQENVDCLVCHDTTGTYRKLPGLSGHPPYQDMEYPPHSGKIVKAPDLKAVAQGGRQDRPAELRRLPLLWRRRRRGEARRPGQLAAQSRQVSRHPHGQGRPQLQLRRVPQDHRPRRARQPLRAHGQRRPGRRAHARQDRTTTPRPARPATPTHRTSRTRASTRIPSRSPARPATSPSTRAPSRPR